MDAKLEQAQKWFFEGIKHFEERRLDQARVAFETALSFAPQRPSVLGNLGITLFHLARPQEALPYLRAATCADPDYTEAWACLGLACGELARWDEAVLALEQTLALSPQQPAAWLTKGQCLVRLGRIDEAVQAYDGALAVAPDFADAWTARGNLMRELGQFDEAADCYKRALTAGGDAELNRYYLASVKPAGSAPPTPRRYIESLFDSYAAEFEGHLVGQLRYEGYQRLLAPLGQSERRFHRALDLGCGTGLCGPLLAPLATVVDGVDLSAEMLKHARQRGVYRELIHADIVAYLQGSEENADLIVAADVFVYIGALDTVLRSARRILPRGGCLAFTVELPQGDEDLQLLPSLRHAHSERYVRAHAQDCGLHIDEILRAPIRYDQTQAVHGLYVYAS